MFRVPTEADAQRLLVAACETNVHGEFVARELAEQQTLANLDAFSERLEERWKLINR